jgi:type IV pilus assembly protein PilV
MPNLTRFQQGSFILEALIAILIFFMGIIGLIALQATAIATTTDTRYRGEANQYVNRILSAIQGNVVRTSDANFRASLDAFAHDPTGGDPGPNGCAFGGGASANPIVTTWITDLSGAASAGRLPEAVAQVRVTWLAPAPSTANQVRVVVCWRQPGMDVMRRHVVVGSIS